MRIAVTNENNMIFQHFGQCKSFAIFQIENDEITSKTILDAGDNGHSALATFLSGNNIDILICGGIGTGAIGALERCGIELVAGVSGNIDDAIEAYMNDSLLQSSDFSCSKQSVEHQAGHSCGGSSNQCC